jgi:hypothetical protein
VVVDQGFEYGLDEEVERRKERQGTDRVLAEKYLFRCLDEVWF